MLKVINPATHQILDTLEEDQPEAVSAKFLAAQRAQKQWAAVPMGERLKILMRFRDQIQKQGEGLAQLLAEEVGKPITQSRNELSGLVGRLNFFFENAESVLSEEEVWNDPQGGWVEKISYEPLGVLGNISAWNYPYFVGSNVFVPALLAGNSVLYKPSEFATLTGLAITRLLHDSGIPREVFIPVIGGGEVGQELLNHPLNGVFFTGSFATGHRVAAAASRFLIKTQLELGGKDPIYVCDDVDVETAAASAADGAFYNTGQSCCAVERIYVHEAIYEKFIECFTSTVQTFQVGAPLDDRTYIGPLTRETHIEHLERQVADAQAKGARLLLGGRKISNIGNYFEPTVFSNVDHHMELMQEETFGPLIGIQKVKSDDEAFQMMSDTKYGLTAGVYSRDEERAKRILNQMNSGSVYWNCCDRVSPRLPWSGRGQSGLGLTLSKHGILSFAQPKAWHLKSG